MHSYWDEYLCADCRYKEKTPLRQRQHQKIEADKQRALGAEE